MPEKDKNQQEGPDVRDNLIRISVGGETVFVDANQYKAKNAGQTAKPRKMKRQPKNPKPGEWISEDYSKHKIADYKPFNFVDGEGVKGSAAPYTCPAASLTARAATTWPPRTSTTAVPTPRNWKTRLSRISASPMFKG
ncbi:hypothetical protein ME808_11790 [Lactobacillus delbrueckii]|nr:hypothetical protein ME808_11790 [Lactobacillus delbrueckii]